MLNFRASAALFALALAGSAFAGYSFSYNNSDTRTAFQDLSNVGVGFQGWNTFMTTDGGDDDLYLNGLNVVTTPGFDPGIVLNTPSSIDYYDYNTNSNATYTLGTAIAGGSTWDFKEIIALDVFNSTSAAEGVYDFAVEFVGGADDTATDILQTYNLHVEVYDRVDLDVSGTSTDITGPGVKGHVTMTVQNNMGKDFVSTTWSAGGYYIDRNDPNSPDLTLEFTGDWFNKTVASGDSRTDDHSDWSLNASSIVGTYKGALGVVGGLHDGDFYFIDMASAPDINVQAVPEPASMVALGGGSLALLRRRRKA